MKRVIASCIGMILLSAGLSYAAEGTHWSYSGHEGPEHWGGLSPEYAMCGTGKNQSPINITGMIEAELEPVQIDYKDVPLDVMNNGHTIKVGYAEGSTMKIEGQTFKLLQFHFHTPSENQIEGKSFPMEAHLVHADNEGNLAVIGVMFDEGKANSSIEEIWKLMPAEAGKTNTASDVRVNVMNMLPANKDYYRFNGSLTTPPCTEGVRWFVMKNPVSASKEQIEKYSHTMHHDTNRPVQPIHARPVLK
ncbi:MAG TPA: carbonic anhydrase [Nitrospiraceae bacterium]|nr:carbonic anhydrase [Nitrospiraceae bacterium]